MKLSNILLVAAIGVSSANAVAADAEQDTVAVNAVATVDVPNWVSRFSCDDNGRLETSFQASGGQRESSADVRPDDHASSGFVPVFKGGKVSCGPR